MRAAAVALLVSGCSAVPFVFGETADTLAKKQVSLAVYGGAGGGSVAATGGAFARVRVGVGHEQEVGIEGGAYVARSGAQGAGKLVWKLHFREYYAVIGGVGVAQMGDDVGVGGDFAIVASTPRLSWPGQVYTGLRASFMTDTRNVAVDGGFVVPLGILFHVTARMHIALEAGGIGSIVYTNALGSSYGGNFGGYGAVLVGGVFGP